MMRSRAWWWIGGLLVLSGCTIKAVGDPKRPITIQAHITIDIRGLKDTASNIEDMVSQGAMQQKGGQEK